MFTGIIQDIGKVKSAIRREDNLVFTISSKNLSGKLRLGASIAINGACQTVTDIREDVFTTEAIAETLEKTNLGMLKTGSCVNLELPVTPQSLLDGHLVQGHIDCVGKIAGVSPQSGSVIITINFPSQYEKYLVPKGSVAVDGISLTVVEVGGGKFTVAIIPHTFENSVLSDRSIGDAVNLEFDIIAKYIEKMTSSKSNGLTVEFLKERGFY